MSEHKKTLRCMTCGRMHELIGSGKGGACPHCGSLCCAPCHPLATTDANINQFIACPFCGCEFYSPAGSKICPRCGSVTSVCKITPLNINQSAMFGPGVTIGSEWGAGSKETGIGYCWAHSPADFALLDQRLALDDFMLNESANHALRYWRAAERNPAAHRRACTEFYQRWWSTPFGKYPNGPVMIIIDDLGKPTDGNKQL